MTSRYVRAVATALVAALVLAACLPGPGAGGPPGVVAAVAGTAFPYPNAVDVGSDGVVVVADPFANRVWQVTPAGVTTVLAGTGTAGFSGDGGPATAAELSRPNGVARAGNGTTYIADTANNRVRAVAPDGTITTVMGTGVEAPADDAPDGQPAATAVLGVVTDVALDPRGRLLVADAGTRKVHRITAAGGVQTLFGPGAPLGGGTPQVGGLIHGFPTAIDMTASGDLVLAMSRLACASGSCAIAPTGTWRAPAGGPLTLLTAGSANPVGFSNLTSVSEFALLQAGPVAGPYQVTVDGDDGVWFFDSWAGEQLRRQEPGGATVGVTEPVTATAAPMVAVGEPLAGHRFTGSLGLAVDSVGTLYLVRASGAAPRSLWSVADVVPASP